MSPHSPEARKPAIPMLRVLRITALAVVLPLLFAISQRVSEASGNEPTPGLSWAIGVVAVLFLIRAIVTEHTAGPEAALQKDLLWGMSAGAMLTILTRWLL